MTVLAAVIIMMAVVLPITSAMGALTQDPEHSDNEIREGDYRMALSTSLTSKQKIVIADTAEGVTFKLGSAAAQTVSATRAVIGDTILITISPNAAVTIYEMDDSFSHIITTVDGDTITLAGNTWTIVHTPEGQSAQTIKGTFKWLYFPSETGEYLHANAPVFVDKGSEILAGGATYSSGARTVVRGTLDHMEVVYSYYDNARNAQANYEPSGYTNSLASVSVLAGGSYVTLTDFIVPFEYTSGMSESLVSTLVFLIPLIMVAALIVAVCYMYVIDRREA